MNLVKHFNPRGLDIGRHSSKIAFDGAAKTTHLIALAYRIAFHANR